MALSQKQYFLVGFLAVLVLALVLYFTSRSPNQPQGPAEKIEEESASTTPVELLPGEVGEVLVENPDTGQEEPLTSPVMPQIISSTVGKVIEATDSYLLIQGNGSNFADFQPRELKCFFADNLIIADKDKKPYQMPTGLSLLQPGREVLVSGAENLRGKTEFQIKAVMILK